VTGVPGRPRVPQRGTARPAGCADAVHTAVSASACSTSATANASGCAADLLTDLRSGYLLGANPRRQFLAQLACVMPGSISVSLFLDALLAWAFERRWRRAADQSLVPPRRG